jgi:GGDEF domain-containing protein
LFPVTVSVGVVEYPVHGSSVDELVLCAEGALKRAKAAGKNKTLVAEVRTIHPLSPEHPFR